MSTEHEFCLDELPNETVETIARRFFERSKESRKEEREVFLQELRNRDVEPPDNPEDVEWFVVEVTEQKSRDLEKSGDYPEARQMSLPKEVADNGIDEEADVWNQTEPDANRVMKVSGWALNRIPEEISSRAVPIEQSQYRPDLF